MKNTNKLIKVIIPQKVKVRKYEVDTAALVLLLRVAKKKSRLTNKQIADKLNQPLTLVEHWFRRDNSFSIPSDSIWIELKELLNIETNCFDASIMEFEIREGVYDKSNRVYDVDGLCPTITATSSETEKIIVYSYL